MTWIDHLEYVLGITSLAAVACAAGEVFIDAARQWRRIAAAAQGRTA